MVVSIRDGRWTRCEEDDVGGELDEISICRSREEGQEQNSTGLQQVRLKWDEEEQEGRR